MWSNCRLMVVVILEIGELEGGNTRLRLVMVMVVMLETGK